LGRENAFMNTIMSVINGQTIASRKADIEKRYQATSEVIAEIQQTKSAMLHEAYWQTLEIYAKVKAKYVWC